MDSLTAGRWTTVVHLCSLCEQLTRCCTPACRRSVVEVIADNAVVMALSQRGCPALIKGHAHCSAAERAVIDAVLLPHLAQLAKDPFANYMVQEMMGRGSAAETEAWVTVHLQGHLAELSVDKYSSNVVQTVLRVCGGSRAVRAMAAAELVHDGAVLRTLAQHPFGNFVLQTLVGSAATLAELSVLERCVRGVVADSPFATNIIAKMTARYAALVPGRRLRVCVAVAKPCRHVCRILVNREDCSAPVVAAKRTIMSEASLLALMRECIAVRGALTYRHDPCGYGRVLYKGGEVAEAWLAKAMRVANSALPLPSLRVAAVPDAPGMPAGSPTLLRDALVQEADTPKH